MIDFKTITLPVTMPLHKKISEAARQIREWVGSYEGGFDHHRHRLRLTFFAVENGLCRFRYEFVKKGGPSLPEEDSADKESEL